MATLANKTGIITVGLGICIVAIALFAYSQISILQANANALCQDNEFLQNQLDQLESQNQELQNQITELQDQIASLETEVNTLSEEKAALESQIYDLTQELTDLRYTIARLQHSDLGHEWEPW